MIKFLFYTIFIGVIIFMLVELHRFGWLVTKQRFALMEKPRVKIIYKGVKSEASDDHQ